MLVHKINWSPVIEGITNVPKYRVERESWKERFRVEVAYEYREYLPKGFILTGQKAPMIAIFVYWIWYLAPFVKLGMYISRLYWSLPQYLFRKGIIDVKDRGAMIPWYWFFIVKWNIMKL